jgi:diguanylate cyclase (GGDEF)-like protein
MQEKTEMAEPEGLEQENELAPVSPWPSDSWPLFIEHLVRGEDYVLLLDVEWRVVRANESFKRSIIAPIGSAGGNPDPSFLETLTAESSNEAILLSTKGGLDGKKVELNHSLPTGRRTVDYSIRRYGSGWVAIGRDQSVQLELVKQMSVLVEELEAKIHRERTLSENLRALAEKDFLTNLPNRRHFERFFEACQRSYESDGQAFSVLCIDVDRYKQVNDLHGHSVGDLVLQRVARILEQSIREGDCAARYGGDEFIILATGIGTPQSHEMAERLRQKVEIAEMPESVKCVTVSVGVASVQPGDPQRARKLMELADNALYAAKSQGRNRVHVAE